MLWNHVSVIISVPSSSANVGPGFDALGIALSVTMDVEIGALTLPLLDETHSAVRAFRLGGGTGPLGGTTKIPPGKGMGFSGAGRVAGFAAAAVQSGRTLRDARDDVFALAAEAEGHPDNAAPSTYGGITITAGGCVVQVPVAVDLSIVVWVPDNETPTRASRGSLPTSVSHSDAAFNVGRVALLVGALTTGDVEALAIACDDRLHQPYRLQGVPETAAAIETALNAGALAAWLSGSGPTMACMTRPDEAEAVAAALPTDGAHVQILTIAPGVALIDR